MVKIASKETLEQVRNWAVKNAASWVIDLLYNEAPAAKRGPLADYRTCDVAAVTFAERHGI